MEQHDVMLIAKDGAIARGPTELPLRILWIDYATIDGQLQTFMRCWTGKLTTVFREAGRG